MIDTTTNNVEISIIPEPQSITVNKDFFDFSGFTKDSPLVFSCPKDFIEQVDFVLPKFLQESFFCKVILDSENCKVTEFVFIKDESLKIEAYNLDIAKAGIKIKASTSSGAFYAMQTLRQLVMTYADYKKIPCLSIIDEPEYEWRGFMIDTCRNFYPVEFLEKMIEQAAFHKMNRFHWHLTDDQGWRINVPEYPLLTKVGGARHDNRISWPTEEVAKFYTDEQITHLVELAKKNCITVVPEIETPGHACALLASYPEYGCTGGPYHVEDRFGVFDDVLCAGNDKVFTLFEAVFDTVCRLFPGPYIHIGGDECPRNSWKKCPKCQKRIKDEHLSSENELQSYLTVKFSKMVEQRGRIPIGWDEVLDGTERLGLPKSMIVQSWRGIEGGKKAAILGHKVIMSPQTNGCYLDAASYNDGLEPGMHRTITVKDSYGFNPIPKDLDTKASAMILGGQCNLWTELIYAAKIAEYMLFPRLCAIAEKTWTKETKTSFEDFSKRLAVHKKRLDKMDVLYFRGPLE